MEMSDLDADLPEPPVENQTRQEGPGPGNQRRQLPNAPISAPSSALPETSASQANAGSAKARLSCINCHRRKQKCNREWPCNHCTKRKIPNECRYAPTAVPQQRRRSASTAAPASAVGTVNGIERSSNPIRDRVFEEGFEALGYASNAAFFSDLTWDPSGEDTQKLPTQSLADAESCLQLKCALQMLTSRRDTDSLVRNFLKTVNFHYYLVHPKTFAQEYEAWWRDRAQGRPLGLEWTCLLLMVCACSTQFPSAKLRKRIEQNSDESCRDYAKRFHNMGRTLRTAMPNGRHHFYNVLQLLHSCYYHKTETRFVEAWHDLHAAVLEAQELRMHKETERQDVPEFQREINRRVWCVLDSWDWQFAALQSRRLIIDRSDCDVSLPGLAQEAYSPSPFLHMKMQSALITRLAARFGEPKDVTSLTDVLEYQNIVHVWTRRFPQEFSMDNPDTSKDEQQPWVKLHRHYLRTVAYSMVLDPIRTHLATKVDSSTDHEMLRIRRDGVNYSLSLMESLYAGVGDLWPRDAKFYFIIFSIFNTAIMHASILLHDEKETVERRDDILDAIDGAISILEKLTGLMKPVGVYLRALTELRKRVTDKLGLDGTSNPSRKRLKTDGAARLKPPALRACIDDDGTTHDDDDDDGSSSSSEILSSDMFGDDAPSDPHPSDRALGAPEHESSGRSQTTSEPLDPPSSVMHPEGAISTTPFFEESYLLPQSTVFQDETLQTTASRAGQRALEEQEFDLTEAPSMEVISDPATDTGLSGEDMVTLAEMWRWDTLEPGSIAANNANQQN